MPISWKCACGKSLRVADELAGRRVKCPACDGVEMVPKADPGFEVVEDTAVSPPPAPRPTSKPAIRAVLADEEDEKPRRRRSEEHDEDELPEKRGRVREDDEERPRKRRRDDDDESDDRPRKKKTTLKAGTKVDKNHHFGMERGILRGGVIGGLAAMVIAVIWFVIGLLNDIIFFYPPVLFVLGLIAMIKGAMGGGEEEHE